MITVKQAPFYSITDVMRHCDLDDEECNTFTEAMCEGEAAYGTNCHSLVTGQYICQTLLGELCEGWSAHMLDKLQAFLLNDCDDKNILIDLEG